MTRTRITVSVPQEIVDAADRHAEDVSRSRSWVVAEAVAAYMSAVDEGPDPRGGTPGTPPTQPAPDGIHGLDPSRLEQLAADLELTPEERVREAELTVRLTQLRQCREGRNLVFSFERYEDYLRWKDREAVALE